MRYLTTFVLFFLLLEAQAQRQAFTGTLLDSTTLEPVQFAHVANYSTGQLAVTTVSGRFMIPASPGDTIVFSIVGYQTLGWEVLPEWLQQEITLKLPQDARLLDDVIVRNIPPEAIFKKRILDHEPVDSSFWYHGMEAPKEREEFMPSDKALHNPLFAILQPADFLYYNFSKQEKEKRKYHKVVQNQSREQRVYQKFSRQWVHEITALEGDQLTEFIFYCDYSLDYLDKTPLYIIREDLIAKLEKFQKRQQG